MATGQLTRMALAVLLLGTAACKPDPLEELRSGDARRVASAADRLTADKSPAGWTKVVAASRDEDPSVRAAAVRIIGRQGDKAVVGMIQEKGFDADPLVRRAAMEAFGDLGNPDAIEWLQTSGASDPDAAVAKAAREAVARLNDVRFSHFVKLATRSTVAEEAVDGIHRVGSSGDPRALATLREVYAASFRPEIRQAVVFAVVEVGGDGARSFTREKLSDPDPVVRAAAIFAVGRLEDAAATADLIAILRKDPSIANRVAAARLLGVRSGQDAIGALEEAVRDPPDEAAKLEYEDALQGARLLMRRSKDSK